MLATIADLQNLFKHLSRRRTPIHSSLGTSTDRKGLRHTKTFENVWRPGESATVYSFYPEAAQLDKTCSTRLIIQ